MSFLETKIHSWSVPDEGWIKINSNGSVDQPFKASCGGILCNAVGHFFGGFIANLGCFSIIVAEIWGAFYSFQ